MSRQKVLTVLPELFLLLGVSTIALAQGATQARSVTPTASADTQEKNIQEYIELLRADVRQQSGGIAGASRAPGGPRRRGRGRQAVSDAAADVGT